MTKELKNAEESGENRPGCGASAGNDGNQEVDLIQETLRVWQPRTSKKLTEEDARQIIERAVEFFRLLDQWERANPLTEADEGAIDEDGR